MKRTVGMLVVAGLMSVSVPAFGWKIPNLVGKQQESGARVDVNVLTAREGSLKLRVNKATVMMANGLVEIQKASGKAAEAARLEAILAEAQKNPSDIEGTKKLCAEVNNASEAMKAVDLDATMNKEEARKSLGKSLLHLGAGMMVDLQASNDAKTLVTDITNSAKVVKAAPLTYGVSAVTKLASGLSTAKFVAETVPTQLTTIADLTSGLVKYAQTNGIEIPTEQEQKQHAATMERE